MAEIRPMKGIRFNTEKADVLKDLVTPPYDVIDSEAQEEYYKKNPYNIIRLELGKTTEEDNENYNQYTRASEYFEQWLQEQVLVKDAEPSIYLYDQKFYCEGKLYTRSSVICGLQLEDYDKNIVVPHEETLPKAKLDRLKLMRECHANFSSIFGLYMDKERNEEEVFEPVKSNQTPIIDFTDENGQTHKVWKVSDESIIKAYQDLLKNEKVYIADGHHRYETALEFNKEMEAQGKKGYDHVMVTLVNIYNPGLVIYPTHRLVRNVKNFNKNNFIKLLEENFETEKHSLTNFSGGELKEEIKTQLLNKADKFHKFAVYFGNDTIYFLSIPKQKRNLDPSRSSAWNSLDVTVLQKVILDELLGIGDEERAKGDYLSYTKDIEEALTEVQKSKYQAAFMINPTKMEEIIEVANSGDKMPQKSTHFYPKLLTGLLLNPLGEQ